MAKSTWRAKVAKLLKAHPTATNAAALAALEPGSKPKALPKAPQAADKDTKLERTFDTHWRLLGFPELKRNVRFHPKRRLELDFYHPASLVGVEINGGIWQAKSGHSSGRGIIRDYEKLLLAQECGIVLIYVPPNWLTKKTVNATCERIWALMQKRTKR